MSRIHSFFRTSSIGLLLVLILISGCNDSTPTPKPAENATDTKSEEKSPDTATSENTSDAATEDKKEETTKEEPKGVPVTIVTTEEYNQELEKYRGKIVFVDFWATWCINCIKEMKHHAEFSKEHEKEGLVIVMMCLDENSDEVKKRASEILAKRECFFPSLMAKDGDKDETYHQYGIEGNALPHYKLYDREGKLIKAYVSEDEKPIDQEAMKKDVVDALKS